MWTRMFWRQVAERSVKTFAAVLVPPLLAGGIFDMDWSKVLGLAAGAALASVLMSIGSVAVGDPNTPSLVPVGAPVVDETVPGHIGAHRADPAVVWAVGRAPVDARDPGSPTPGSSRQPL